MLELAAVDDLFQHPITAATSIESALADIDPSLRVIGETGRTDEAAESGADARYLVKTASGADLYIYETDGEVWIDVSRMREGEGGNAVYAAVADYALNTGRRFIGDPAGLSDEALRRRTDAMLSSALKHRTTDHLAPHARQIEGDAALGVPPLRWTDGATLANIKALIEVSTESLSSIVPEIERASYDFASRTFRTGEGKPLTDDALQEWANASPRARAARAGRRTLKRGILLRSLARQASERRPGLLELVLRQPRDLVARGGLSGTFYDRSAAARAQPRNGGAFTRQGAVRVARDATPRLRALGIADRIMLRVAEGRTAGPNAAYVDRIITIMRDRGRGWRHSLDHEVIHALRDLGLFTPREWNALARAARADAAIVARVQAAYPLIDPARPNVTHRRNAKGERVRLVTPGEQVEEMVAELFADWARGRADAGAVRQLLERIASAFRALASALRGEGFIDGAMAMERIERGEVGRRSAGAWSWSRGLQLPKDTQAKHRRDEKILHHRDVFKNDESVKEQRDTAPGIREVIEAARRPGHAPQKAETGTAAAWVVEAARAAGMDIAGLRHVIDGSAVRHIFKKHGQGSAEASRGQVTVGEPTSCGSVK